MTLEEVMALIGKKMASQVGPVESVNYINEMLNHFTEDHVVVEDTDNGWTFNLVEES